MIIGISIRISINISISIVDPAIKRNAKSIVRRQCLHE
jgi:hypothetical protein